MSNFNEHSAQERLDLLSDQLEDLKKMRIELDANNVKNERVNKALRNVIKAYSYHINQLNFSIEKRRKSEKLEVRAQDRETKTITSTFSF